MTIGLICARCGDPIPEDRSRPKCNACHQVQVRAWRAGLTLGPTKEFPGVDIDAIHYKRGAVRLGAKRTS